MLIIDQLSLSISGGGGQLLIRHELVPEAAVGAGLRPRLVQVDVDLAGDRLVVYEVVGLAAVVALGQGVQAGAEVLSHPPLAAGANRQGEEEA